MRRERLGNSVLFCFEVKLSKIEKKLVVWERKLLVIFFLVVLGVVGVEIGFKGEGVSVGVFLKFDYRRESELF